MQDGLAHVYMARLNRVTAVRENMLALVSGLREVTVVTSGAGAVSVRVHVEFEPALLALGPSHLAAVAHNKVCFSITIRLLVKLGPCRLMGHDAMAPDAGACLPRPNWLRAASTCFEDARVPRWHRRSLLGPQTYHSFVQRFPSSFH